MTDDLDYPTDAEIVQAAMHVTPQTLAGLVREFNAGMLSKGELRELVQFLGEPA